MNSEKEKRETQDEKAARHLEVNLVLNAERTKVDSNQKTHSSPVKGYRHSSAQDGKEKYQVGCTTLISKAESMK